MADTQYKLLDLVDTPDWYELDAPTKEALVRDEVSQSIKNPTEENINSAVKDYTRKLQEAEYRSQFNPINIEKESEQENADASNYIHNVSDKISSSFSGLLHRLPLIDDVLPGNNDTTDLAANLSYAIQKEDTKPVTENDLRYQKAIAKANAKNSADGWAEFALEVAKHPQWAINMGAESSSSVVSYLAPYLAGGITGTAVTGNPVVGMVSSRIAGSLGSAADAATYKLIDRVRARLAKEHKSPTQSNIQDIINNDPEFIKKSKVDAEKYGAAISAMDAIAGGAVGGIERSINTAARKAVIKEINQADRAAIRAIAKQTNKSVKEVTSAYVNKAAIKKLGSRSLSKKLAIQASQHGLDVAGEVAGEAVATKVAGEKNTVQNLTEEAMGSVGMSPIHTAMDKAIWGGKKLTSAAYLTGKVGSSVAKQALTKKTEDAKKAEAQLKTKITEAKKATPDAIEKAADTESEHFNPVTAVVGLSENPSEENLDKSTNVVAHVRKDLADTIKKWQALDTKEKLTKQEKKQLAELDKEIGIKEALFKKVSTIHSKHEAKLDLNNAEELKEIDPNNATTEEVGSFINKVVGSLSSKTLSNEAADTLLKREDLTDNQKQIIKDIKALNVYNFERINSQNKNIDHVRDEVFQGSASSEFRGINSYLRAIAHYVQKGDTEKATNELNSLDAFGKKHQHKYDVFTKVYEHITNPNTKDKPLPTKLKKEFDEIKETSGNLNFTIHKNSKKLIDIIGKEAAAIQAAHNLGSSLLNHATQEENNTNTETNTDTSSSNTNINNTDMDTVSNTNSIDDKNSVTEDTEDTTNTASTVNVDDLISSAQKQNKISDLDNALKDPSISDKDKRKIISARKNIINNNNNNNNSDNNNDIKTIETQITNAIQSGLKENKTERIDELLNNPKISDKHRRLLQKAKTQIVSNIDSKQQNTKNNTDTSSNKKTSNTNESTESEKQSNITETTAITKTQNINNNKDAETTNNTTQKSTSEKDTNSKIDVILKQKNITKYTKDAIKHAVDNNHTIYLEKILKHRKLSDADIEAISTAITEIKNKQKQNEKKKQKSITEYEQHPITEYTNKDLGDIEITVTNHIGEKVTGSFIDLLNEVKEEENKFKKLLDCLSK